MPWQRNLLENPQTSSRPAPTRAPALEASNAPDAPDANVDDEERQLPLCGLD